MRPREEPARTIYYLRRKALPTAIEYQKTIGKSTQFLLESERGGWPSRCDVQGEGGRERNGHVRVGRGTP